MTSNDNLPLSEQAFLARTPDDAVLVRNAVKGHILGVQLEPKAMLDTMYEIPSQQDVSKVVIDESVIDGSSKPLLIYENSEPPAKAAPDA